MFKFQYYRKGISLIELLLSISLLGIIILVVYSLFFVGNKSYSIGKDTGFAQQDGRIIADFINSELRVAKDIKSEQNDYVGKYYSLELNELGQLIKTEWNEETPISRKILGNAKDLKFNRHEDDQKGIIRLTMETVENGQQYNLEFEILLENLPNFDFVLENIDTVYYSKHE